jgi:translation initiation factor 1|tara:strand:- start:9366 stop:9767 length:402 start_codon:yes stop_codon:yes gene_type:complete
VSKRGKKETDGGDALGQNPFGALSGLDLPQGQVDQTPLSDSVSPAKSAPKSKNRGRVDIKRSTAGRGGKTVTVISGFTGIGLPEKEKLAKQMRNACGCGGTVKDGQIEIQGDKREQIAEILTEVGFLPVMAGG